MKRNQNIMLTEKISSVNAYADYLQGEYRSRDHSQFPTRNRDVVTLRNAAIEILEELQNWPEIERLDGQHIVLLAPDGTHILYSYEDNAERLTIL